MQKTVSILFILLSTFSFSYAQHEGHNHSANDGHNHGVTTKPTRTINVESPKPGMQTFIWHSDNNKLPKLKLGEQHPIHGRIYTDDGTMMINDFGFNPAVPVAKESFGFLLDGITKMTPGDSAILRVLADSLFGANMPPQFKSGDFLKFSFVAYTKEDGEKKAAIAQAEAERKKAAQVTLDDALLQKYFADNNLKPLKTADGLYYIITQTGVGEKAAPGQTIVANYSGKLLDGTKFDSNIDTTFHHVQPFEFGIGKNQVIQGWDKGFQLLNKGSKATFFLPSSLAYGERGAGDKIKPFSCLIFDVELVDIKLPPASDDDVLQDFFKKNNLKPLKTADGLYYTITKQGNGEVPKVGQTVVASYTGSLLDGTKFDSNVLPEFNHVQPFEFQVGKGMVIQGWDKGFGMFNKGTKATLYIPSKLAYGENGAGGAIKPNSCLIFDIELLDIK